jgi:hypothetical protein
MPTCQQSIQSKIDQGTLDSIVRMTSNTAMPISMTSSLKQLFALDIIRQETVQFTISLISRIQPTNIGVTVHFYQLGTANEIILLGSVLVTEMILSFQKDFTVGSYIICIGSTTFSYTGTLTGVFTGFPIYANLVPRAYTGSALNPIQFDTTLPERRCVKTLYFEIIDGHLPPGLTMGDLGNIEGVLPNMDCIDENADLSPSQNWYYNIGSTWQPWGRQWRFLIRTWVFDYPEASTERWFCIRVHNNWSWDRDNHPALEYDEDEIVVPDDPVLPPEVCCEPVPDPEPFIPQIIPKICPCETESTTEQAIVLNFMQWYQNVLLNPPGEDSPYIQTFIDNFRKSEYFVTMMEKSGISDALLTFEEKELKAVEMLIQMYTDSLVNGRNETDIDAVMLTLRDEQNQKLPITVLTMSGSSLLDFELSK